MSSNERKIINDVLAPTWRQYGEGKTHAFLIPDGEEPTGKVRAMCPGSFDSGRLTDPGTDRCKTCTRKTAVDTRKRTTGLSEPKLPNVNAGATEAPTIGARDGGTHMDGPALVKGPNMSADPAKRPMWRNPATGEREPAAAYLDGSLRDRLDREVAGPRVTVTRTKAQQRKFRARNTAERQMAARLARQSSGKRA